MSVSKITHIRLSGESSQLTDKITHVKLSDDTVETVAQVVLYIDNKNDYYYVDSSGARIEVESVHPSGKLPYIRTKSNATTKDNLLNLPTF